MRRLSRRDMLVMAGTASAVPLVTGAALGSPARVAALTKCTVITGPTVSLWANPAGTLGGGATNAVNIPVNSNDSQVPITYIANAGGTKWVFPLPWTPHIFLTCPQMDPGTGFPLTQHTFSAHYVKTAAGVQTHLHVGVQAEYSVPMKPKVIQPPMCCFGCGEQEICIPKGHSFLCNGIEITC